MLMTTQSGSGPQSGHLAQAVLKGLQDLLEEISDDVSRRNKCKLFTRRVLTAYEEGDLDSLDRQLPKEPDDLAALYPSAHRTVRELRLEVARRLAVRFDRLAQYLAEYSESKGIALRGLSPNFVVAGLIGVVLNKENRAAKVGASYIRTLAWDRIRESLDSEWERVWGRQFDASTYRDEVVAAYHTAMQRRPNPSRWVALNDVYQMLKEHREEEHPDWRQSGRVAGYYKDEFSADLSKLWGAQIEGSLLPPHVEFSAIRDPRRAYEVVMRDGSAAKYGFVRPRRM